MKQTMMFAIMATVAIILMVAFDVRLNPNAVPVSVGDIPPNALFVCPVGESAWTSAAHMLMNIKKPIQIGLVFATLVLISVWAWALYQNLLKDKFDRGVYKNPWGYTKLLFWACVVVFMLMKTPDSFRFVHVDGLTGDWVLCDATSKNARMENINKIHDMKQ